MIASKDQRYRGEILFISTNFWYRAMANSFNQSAMNLLLHEIDWWQWDDHSSHVSVHLSVDHLLIAKVIDLSYKLTSKLILLEKLAHGKMTREMRFILNGGSHVLCWESKCHRLTNSSLEAVFSCDGSSDWRNCLYECDKPVNLTAGTLDKRWAQKEAWKNMINLLCLMRLLRERSRMSWATVQLNTTRQLFVRKERREVKSNPVMVWQVNLHMKIAKEWLFQASGCLQVVSMDKKKSRQLFNPSSDGDFKCDCTFVFFET